MSEKTIHIVTGVLLISAIIIGLFCLVVTIVEFHRKADRMMKDNIVPKSEIRATTVWAYIFSGLLIVSFGLIIYFLD